MTAFAPLAALPLGATPAASSSANNATLSATVGVTLASTSAVVVKAALGQNTTVNFTLSGNIGQAALIQGTLLAWGPIGASPISAVPSLVTFAAGPSASLSKAVDFTLGSSAVVLNKATVSASFGPSLSATVTNTSGRTATLSGTVNFTLSAGSNMPARLYAPDYRLNPWAIVVGDNSADIQSYPQVFATPFWSVTTGDGTATIGDYPTYLSVVPSIPAIGFSLAAFIGSARNATLSGPVDFSLSSDAKAIASASVNANVLIDAALYAKVDVKATASPTVSFTFAGEARNGVFPLSATLSQVVGFTLASNASAPAQITASIPVDFTLEAGTNVPALAFISGVFSIRLSSRIGSISAVGRYATPDESANDAILDDSSRVTGTLAESMRYGSLF